jgi:hypothetical protein
MGRATAPDVLVVVGSSIGNDIMAEKPELVLNILVRNLLMPVRMFKRQVGIKAGILFLYAQGITTSEVKS